VAAFGGDDDDIEGGQVGLELEPGIAAAAGGVGGVEALDDEAFVAAVARGGEAGVEGFGGGDFGGWAEDEGGGRLFAV
jgi:hypothetical protein